jgi:hypothetical protein
MITHEEMQYLLAFIDRVVKCEGADDMRFSLVIYRDGAGMPKLIGSNDPHAEQVKGMLRMSVDHVEKVPELALQQPQGTA